MPELDQRWPELNVAGTESPPFRPLSAPEDREIVRRINASGAAIVFVGLGYPKQDRFAFEHRQSIQAVQICVGAAFDFLSGNKTRARAGCSAGDWNGSSAWSASRAD